MRKCFFSLIGLFLLTSVIAGCGDSAKEAQAKKEAAEKARQDSINAAIAQAKADSIEKARQDSLEEVLKVENTIVFITDFYKKCLDNRFNFNTEEKAVKENCTNKFYKEWKEITSPEPDPESGMMSYPCEYDPIICEQSCRQSPQIEKWKNLQVESLGDDDYEVRFRLKWEDFMDAHRDETKKTLRIKVTEENGVTKISEIKDMNPK